MIDYLANIAVKGNKNRKESIEKILQDNNIPFRELGWRACNIVVSANPSIKERIVIGAHYDAAREDIEAANDNAAACVILLNLIINLYNETDKGYDFIFFDLEDDGRPVVDVRTKKTIGCAGSIEYIIAKGKGNIEALINLDMCGLGNNIVLSYSSVNTDLNNVEPYKSIIQNCNNIVEKLANGDSVSFNSCGISNIFIINSTDNDLEFFKNYHKGGERYENTDFYKTIHTSADTVDSFSHKGMKDIYNYLIKYL